MYELVRSESLKESEHPAVDHKHPVRRIHDVLAIERGTLCGLADPVWIRHVVPVAPAACLTLDGKLIEWPMVAVLTHRIPMWHQGNPPRMNNRVAICPGVDTDKDIKPFASVLSRIFEDAIRKGAVIRVEEKQAIIACAATQAEASTLDLERRGSEAFQEIGNELIDTLCICRDAHGTAQVVLVAGRNEDFDSQHRHTASKSVVFGHPQSRRTQTSEDQ
jgi:hypothetical protein